MRLAVLKSFSSLVSATCAKQTPRLSQQRHCLKKLPPDLSAVLICARYNSTDKNNKQQHADEDETTTVAEIERRWSGRFEKEGIAEPIESIQHIIAHVLNVRSITDLPTLKSTKLHQEQIEKLELLCECRLSRMPVQYIIGEWDFRDITLKMEPPIFVPRPETETLVDFLLKRASEANKDTIKVLEIGCGSGAISLSFLNSYKKANVVAIDLNLQACELTLRNAKNLGLDDKLVVLNAELSPKGGTEVKKTISTDSESVDLSRDSFDIIVSNPPYISTEAIFKLQPEIKLYEDIKALDGGFDGLRWIEAILKYTSEHLNPGGYLILEVDHNHPERVKYLVEKLYEDVLEFKHVHKDFCNKDRFVEIVKV